MKQTMMMAALALASAAQADFVKKVEPGSDLAAVRDEVRAARKSGAVKPGEKVEVVLAPGIYVMKSALQLGKDDGGEEGNPVVWRAEKPGTVRVRGAATVKASEFTSVTDPKTKSRFPEEVRERVRETSLKAYFPTPPKEWGKMFTHVPDAPWAYCGGTTMELARWPNVGANDLTGPEPQEKGWCWFTNAVDIGVNPKLPGKEREYPIRPGAIRFTDPRALRWNVDDGVWMYGYWVHDWYAVYQRVGTFTPSNQVVRFADKVMFGVGGSTCGGNKRRFIVINAPEELDAPGEWWFDRKTSKFYCLPPAGKENEDVMVALDVQLVKANGASHLRFEGMAFEYTHSGRAAVSVDGSRDVVFSRCEFRNHAGTGLAFGGGYDCRAEDCVFAGFGGNAINASGGDRRWLVPARHAILRCDVYDYARWNRQAFPIHFEGCGLALRETHVHDGPCGAISYGGNDHLIADNEFDHVMLEACDAGALYTGRNPSTQGHVIFGNDLHDLSLDPAMRKYRSGFYFDDCDWGDDVIGNRVNGVGLAVHVGGGSMHGVWNNLFEDCEYGILMGSRGYSWKREWRGSFAVDDKTGLGWAEAFCAPFHHLEAPWCVAYPRLPELLNERPEFPHGNSFSNNVFVACKKPIQIEKRAAKHNGEPPLSANVIVSNLVDSPKAPFWPVKLKDAARCVVASPDGAVEATFALDVTSRFSWSLKRGGKTVVDVSTLGVTVDGRDFGKLVVPAAASPASGEGNFFANCWRLLASGAEKEAKDVKVSAWKGATIPLRDLVTGAECAALDVRVWNGGVAYRWRVPGKGVRKIAGEMNAWAFVDEKAVEFLEADRHEDWPEFYPQPRCAGVKGVVFPERPRGWTVAGDATFPWRITLFK